MPDGRDGRVVLIVQEELVIRMDVVEAFKTGGFKVFQADTAEKAIDVLQRELTIRVVFTDVDLPGTKWMDWRSHTMSAIGGRQRSF